MSDRSNRDKGRKVQHKKTYGKYACGCWHCEDGAYKKRTILARANTKQKTRQLELVDTDQPAED